MEIHCSKISHDQHKHRDGVWSIEFDTYLNRVSVVHGGYVWENIVSRHTRNLLHALEEFSNELNKHIRDVYHAEGIDPYKIVRDKLGKDKD